MASIVFEQVRFHYQAPYQQVFTALDLVIETGWRTAIVGRNGRGKTTLLRLVAGELEPTGGRLTVPVAARLFPVAPSHPERSARAVARAAIAPFDRWRRELAAAAVHSPALWGELQERFAAAGGWEVDARIDREVTLLGLDPELLERPFATLSGGEQTRVQIAALFLAPDTFALIDEPTNHLDLGGRELLARYLRVKPGFVLASHDRALLDACADHTVSIERGGGSRVATGERATAARRRRGAVGRGDAPGAGVAAVERVALVRGGYSAWRREEGRRLEREARRRETLAREVSQLRGAARDRRSGAERREREKRGAGDKGFVGHRAAKQMKRAIEIERRVERRLEERAVLLRQWEKDRSLALETDPDGVVVPLVVSGLELRLHGRVLIEGLSLELRRGARVALTGPNGCGKTRLLDAVTGEPLPPGFSVAGAIRLSPRATVVRAHQVPRWREGRLRDRLRGEGIEESRFRQVLGALDVEGELFEHPLETLSEGQRKKAELARSFLRPHDLLVWDEPVNYLDVETRERVEEAILDSDATLLLVEHDRAFLERVATEVIELGSR